MAELVRHLGPAGLLVTIAIVLALVGVVAVLARISAWAASIGQTFIESLALATAWVCATASTSFLILAALPIDGVPIVIIVALLMWLGLQRALFGVPVFRALLVAGVFLPMLTLTLIAGSGLAGLVVDRLIHP